MAQMGDKWQRNVMLSYHKSRHHSCFGQCWDQDCLTQLLKDFT